MEKNINANLELVRWVLETQTAYKISKVTGIRDTTISRWNTGKTELRKMSFDNAIKLTDYARTLKENL
ncbi:XRE family transcriptional regulator [Streptococcaceae bacterium ESL0687]|nr:XRE family transcriptional regulator [Streptococcaceae bacterium ESL0687]